MKINETLYKKYKHYYGQETLSEKRAIAANQTIQHLINLSPNCGANILDIGAGDGSLLKKLQQFGIGENLYALEISVSGIKTIKEKQIPNLRSVEQFDGYNINAKDNEFDFGVAAHVLEHVEHERAFLQEITRVCSVVYIEVPLEFTLNLRKSIRISGKYGHINFYNPTIFENLVETSGLEIIAFQIFPNSLEYEQYISGKTVGTIKFLIRRGLLYIAPRLAPHFMTYLASVLCQKKTYNKQKIQPFGKLP